jgi:hypothetical protein
MAKFKQHSIRKDKSMDHMHALPDGEYTGGMLRKPNANYRAGWHTHLYQHDGMVYETDAAYDDGDHVHDVFLGKKELYTGKPMPVEKHRGHEMGREDAAEHDPEEQVMKDFLVDVDEGLWEKAKKASQEQYGAIKWPVVQSIYQKAGGK